MGQESSTSGAAPAISPAPKRFSIRQEARAAILAEQLAYLLDHGDFCPKGCPDCERLRTVEEALLVPFRERTCPPPAA